MDYARIHTILIEHPPPRYSVIRRVSSFIHNQHAHTVAPVTEQKIGIQNESPVLMEPLKSNVRIKKLPRNAEEQRGPSRFCVGSASKRFVMRIANDLTKEPQVVTRATA